MNQASVPVASQNANSGSGTFGSTPSLASIVVTPANASIAKGRTQQFTATGMYSDGSTQDITTLVSWSSSNATVAAVNARGVASGLGNGKSSIQASLSPVIGSATLTITPALLSSLTVTPADPLIVEGSSQQFVSTGLYGDGSTQDLTSSVVWSSSLATVATINASGLATGEGAGTSIIGATFGGISGSANLTVSPTPLPISVAISPSSATVQVASGTQSFVAMVTNDVQNQGVTWTISGQGCSGVTCGTLSATSSASGAAISYTAPAVVPVPPTVTLTATSLTDGTRFSSATISIGSGTPNLTFTESFNNGSSLCWSGGPAFCDQTWIAQGSAQSISPTPGTPAPSTAGPNSLQMTEAAQVASNIYTTGSFPRLPAGTAFDLYFTLDLASQAMNAFDATSLLTASNDATGTEYAAQISFAYDGANLQLQAAGASIAPAIKISLNAWHAIHLHLSAGANTSFMVIDGGSPSAFTENLTDFAYLVLGPVEGDLDAMTYFVGNISVSSELGGGPPPSAYIDFETATNGTTITTDVLAAGTHCGNGIWSLSTDPITGLAISAAAPDQLPSPVTTCGTQYSSTAESRALQYDMSQTARRATYTWTTTSNSASVGFFFQITLSDTNYYTVFNIEADTGSDYAALNIHDSAMYLETKSGIADGIPISPNTWYWVTLQYNAGGTHYMQVYDSTTWVLLGSTSGAATGNYQPTAIEIGRNGSESGFPSGYWYYDSIILDYVTAKYPIVPPSY